jgi:hypothetical protein
MSTLVREEANEKVTLPSEERSSGLLKLYSVLITGISVLIPAVLVLRLFLNYRYEFYQTHTEGVWLATANDFAHGVMYRPLSGPLGYGGSRYLPLYFVLTGVLSRIFGGVETAGLVLSATCVVLLVVASYVLLRRLNVNVLLSVAAVTAILATVTTQRALFQTRGDALAAMLNVWGLASCVGLKNKRASLYLAAILFALAFAAKLTTIFGVGAVVLSWGFSRRYKEALQLALATVSGYVLVVLAMHFGSGGRVLGIFRMCAGGGGGSLLFRLQAPFHLILRMLEDPVTLLFLIPAVVWGLVYFQDHKTDIWPIHLVLVLLATMAIFTTQGISYNHLLDLHVAAVLLLVLALSRTRAPAEVATGMLAVILLVACVPTLKDLHGDFLRPRFRVEAERVLAWLPADTRPVLAENPLLVLKSGKTPYLLDAFMFRVLTQKRPELGKEMWDKITHKDFAAILLEHDPTDPAGKEWFTEMHFGGEFLQDLEANYSRRYDVNDIHVYLPK